MAKLLTTRLNSRYGIIWGDPDLTKSRIFIDTYAYDYSTLTARPAETFYWQTRANTFNTSADFDNYGPVNLAIGIDGTAFSASQNDFYYMPGVWNTWQCSLDLNECIPTLAWRTTARNGLSILSYPRSAPADNLQSDHWCGPNMSERAQSWRHTDTLANCHLFERTDQLNFNALSWSYSGTTITVNWNSHGLQPGDTVTISGALATTFPPNGTWIVYTTATNSFTYITAVAPTGTAAGTMNVVAECRSAFGIETENGASMTRLNVLKGYQWTYSDNSATAGISRPTYTTLNSSDWKFYMGRDDYFVYMLQMAGGTTNAYTVNRYYIPRGVGSTTTMISAQLPASAASSIILAYPSNIRHASSTRKVLYSGHFNTSNVLAPMRLVWTKGTTAISFTPTNVTFSTTTITVTRTDHGFKVGDVIAVTGLTATTNAPNGNFFAVATVPSTSTFTYTALATPTGTIGFASANISGVTTSEALPIVKTDCALTYPAGTTFTTYSAIPTAGSWNGNGINNWWCQPYQFTKDSVNYITFTVSDSFFYSSQARFPTVKSRTWMTFTIGAGTGDDALTFHSAFNFPAIYDFPLSWSPYGHQSANQDKVLIYGTNGTGMLQFIPTSFNADSWSYASDVDGVTTSTITVTKTAHGLSIGDVITTSGATAATNAPNGVYRVFSVPTADTFKFIADSTMSGVITGTAAGVMNVKVGWRGKYNNNIRTRGYGVDELDRIWLTSRNSTVGRVTVHVLNNGVPANINIRLQNADPNSIDDTRYVYSGSDINTNLLVDAYDAFGNRMQVTITLNIAGDSMRFSTGEYYTKSITTSSSATTNVAVVITGAGRSAVSAVMSV